MLLRSDCERFGGSARVRAARGGAGVDDETFDGSFVRWY